MMTDVTFIEFVKNTVRDYTNEHLDKSDNTIIGADDVFVVWYCINYQPMNEERMVVDMMCCQNFGNEVIDCIRNSGERVVMYECRGVGFYRCCFGTVVFMDRVVE